MPRRNTGKSDNLTDHFTNIEIPTCTHTFFLMFQQLGGNGTGIFFAILGRGPRAFQIGKISAVNHYFGKFSEQTRTAFLASLKTKLAITHTIAIKLKENRMQF